MKETQLITNHGSRLTDDSSLITGYPKVSIIILNWNGWKDTIECLESIQQLSYSNYQIIVVDNGSTDCSVEKIKAWAIGELSTESKFFRYDPNTKPVYWVEYDRPIAETGGNPQLEAKINNFPSSRRLVFIQTGENLGFAGGNNVAIRYALKGSTDYIFLLNNDAIVTTATLQKLTKAMTANPQFGVATPRIYYYDEPHRIWNSGGRLTITGSRHYYDLDRVDAKEYSGVSPTNIRVITFVTGCALLIRRGILEKLGLLSEDFFIGEEDYDFSLRMQENKVKMVCVNNACVYHKMSQSVQKLFQGKLNSAFIHHLNRFIHLKKHYPRFYWRLWRFGALCYILPMLYLRYRVDIKSLISYSSKLVAYSNKYDRVTREIISQAQEEAL